MNSLQREQARIRKQRQRERDKSVTFEERDTQDNVTRYPAIILALADPVKREKLERIAISLKNHNQLDGVRYGIGGPTFTQVDKMLDALH